MGSRRAPRRARRGAALALVVALGAALPAGGHIVSGTRSVSLLTSSADLVVRARISDGAFPVVSVLPRMQEDVVVAEVLEVWKGSPLEGSLTFAQHGHGVPLYQAGEEAVVFLQRIERSKEFADTPVADRVRFFSPQEAGAKFVLDEETREPYRRAVRAYAVLGAIESPQARREALRSLTFELLASPDPILSSSALGDLALLGEALPITADDVPALAALVANPKVRIGVRIGVLAELERRELLEAPTRWARLLRDARGSDRLAVVRAAAAHPSPDVNRELTSLLAAEDATLAAAAAVSLGVPGNDEAVKPLSRALASESWRLRMSAIRGLGRLGTGAARAALAEAAETHADAATRRRASAELETLARRASRDAQTGPPTR